MVNRLLPPTHPAISTAPIITPENFTLGFTLPNQWTQKLMIDKVRVYFSGNNLLTWAKWKQYDPETPVNGEVFCEAPAMRTFSFGAQLSF